MRAGPVKATRRSAGVGAHTRRRVVLAAALAGLAMLGGTARARADTERTPLVAAAASVRFALDDLAENYRRQTGQSVRLSFGSSGNLARQIREGAPYEVYLAADPGYVQALARDGFTRDEGRDYLLGRLAIIVPLGSALTADGTLDDLRAALADGRLRRFAIANPEHAPYGLGAQQALDHAGLWEEIRDRLVLGENVGQAAQFAVSGNAEGGIIGYALALEPVLAARSASAPIPEEWHTALRHRAVLLRSAGPAAQRFYEYLRSPAAVEIFEQHGFHVPGASD